MSRLASEWAERKFKLPRRIMPTTERNLSNGYLFCVMATQMGLLSGEEMAGANDGTNPDVVMQNFVVLSQALRRVTPSPVSLSKKDVVKIISEESGAAADLVMRIKATVEVENSVARPRTPPYKKVIKSQRPPDEGTTTFRQRQQAKMEERSAEDEVLREMLSKNKDIDEFKRLFLLAQLSGFELFQKRQDDIIRKATADAEAAALKVRADVHDTLVGDRHTKIKENRDSAARLRANHQKDLAVGRSRLIRDTQFEMATFMRADFKKKATDFAASSTLVRGVEEFEEALQRSGRGGGADGGTDDLTISREDGGAFLARLEVAAEQAAPTDAECAGFLSRLKVRTTAARDTREGKEKRMRKVRVVSQRDPSVSVFLCVCVSLSRSLSLSLPAFLLRERSM
jgi:hypothetical protein